MALQVHDLQDRKACKERSPGWREIKIVRVQMSGLFRGTFANWGHVRRGDTKSVVSFCPKILGWTHNWTFVLVLGTRTCT